MPSDKGWKSIPLYTAIEKGDLDSETIAEIEGELIFFTCVSMINKKNQIQAIMDTVNGLWGSQTTSLNSMEFQNSLMTSTEVENSGEMETTSSLPV